MTPLYPLQRKVFIEGATMHVEVPYGFDSVRVHGPDWKNHEAQREIFAIEDGRRFEFYCEESVRVESFEEVLTAFAVELFLRWALSS